MGVKTLWSILSGSGEMIDLRELQGSSVAIDLAGWIVQNNTCKGMTGNVSRPHLRNLFFRTATLINLNIKPIFVLDGDAPDLKKETLEARRRAQSQTQEPVEVKNFSRARLKGLMTECKALLDCLGIESVKADGEAEALCARLNAAGVVDAVISDDSDAFCYGAKVLLRNFSISSGGSNGACVEKYTIDKLETTLKLDRNRLTMMAILLGCDFCPMGVPGVGKETVLHLFESWPQQWNALGALRYWIKTQFKGLQVSKSKTYSCSKCDDIKHCDDCDQWSFAVESWCQCHCKMLQDDKNILKLEENLKKKCAEESMISFWTETFEKVVAEFKTSSQKQDIKKVGNVQAACPQVDKFVQICTKKMAWTDEYALEKILPLISRWQVKKKSSAQVLKALKIVKQRTVHGTPSFTILWEWNEDTKPSLAPETFETCEPTLYLQDFCPRLIDEFEANKKKPKKSSKKKAVVAPAAEKSPPKITQFFKETRKKATTKVDKFKIEEAMKNESLLSSEDEQLPDNLSFLIDDILSHKMKRNLSIDTDRKCDTAVTSTPVRPPLSKKLITPSKITPDLSDDLEDSFDRMCNAKKGAFCNFKMS